MLMRCRRYHARFRRRHADDIIDFATLSLYASDAIADITLRHYAIFSPDISLRCHFAISVDTDIYLFLLFFAADAFTPFLSSLSILPIRTMPFRYVFILMPLAAG
jgi:hypothetical protein